MQTIGQQMVADATEYVRLREVLKAAQLEIDKVRGRLGDYAREQGEESAIVVCEPPVIVLVSWGRDPKPVVKVRRLLAVDSPPEIVKL